MNKFRIFRIIIMWTIALATLFMGFYPEHTHLFLKSHEYFKYTILFFDFTIILVFGSKLIFDYIKDYRNRINNSKESINHE